MVLEHSPMKTRGSRRAEMASQPILCETSAVDEATVRPKIELKTPEDGAIGAQGPSAPLAIKGSSNAEAEIPASGSTGPTRIPLHEEAMGDRSVPPPGKRPRPVIVAGVLCGLVIIASLVGMNVPPRTEIPEPESGRFPAVPTSSASSQAAEIRSTSAEPSAWHPIEMSVRFTLKGFLCVRVDVRSFCFSPQRNACIEMKSTAARRPDMVSVIEFDFGFLPRLCANFKMYKEI